jgi:hypothetical protein
MKKYKSFQKPKITELHFSSFTEALKMNSPFRLPENRIFYSFEGKQLKEGISYVFEDKGGIIVFSTEVNAMIDTKDFVSKVKGFFKSKYQSFKNVAFKDTKLDSILKKFPDVQAYSIGNFFKGRYFDRKTGKTYDEKSLSIEIIGIPSKLLVPIAEEIAESFNQKEVLVKDHDTGKIFLVDTK